MSEHTPGPWVVAGGSYNDWRIKPIGKDVYIATLFNRYGWASEGEANARLIAAAPDMADEIERLKADQAKLLEIAKGVDELLNGGDCVIAPSDGGLLSVRHAILAALIATGAGEVMAQ